MAIKAVETIRKIRDEQYEQTKDLPPDERRNFFREKARLAMEKIRQSRERRKS